ncbi:hypothetical protein [Cellulomonas edaphi]|uniref:Alternate-type signal peptide domain-containing protein n=1 Tax=Cellulomonas edaphi TaxID=3053468 RepID=A0ABT7S4F2_9CELL|nr:hypothetical protein [Cellulomons edaphi]MDM7830492.1 hypothetical protein [Cellulomons edaphi]
MTTTTPRPADATDTDRKKRKRGAIIKLSLAGAALLGIGAAATSAYWTNDAWFSATATGATIDLQGENFAATPAFVSADDSASSIVIPAAQLQNLVQGEKRTFTLKIKNVSSVPLDIATTSAWVAAGASDFTTAPTVAFTGAPTSLAANSAATTVTVTVTTPTTWASTNQGKSQAVRITFTGTATPAVAAP